jgi:hypothetical protein
VHSPTIRRQIRALIQAPHRDFGHPYSAETGSPDLDEIDNLWTIMKGCAAEVAATMIKELINLSGLMRKSLGAVVKANRGGLKGH